VAQLASPITTSRVTLRRFVREDVEALSVLYGDERVVRYLYWVPADRERTIARLKLSLDRPEGIVADNVLPVAVVLNQDGHLIGDFMLRWRDDEHRQGEIGGSLLPSVHGNGYAAEIYHVLLRLGFEEYGLHRIVGRCDGRNTASIRSLEKAGLHEEAHFVENEFVKGEWTDEVVMAIRRDEWARKGTRSGSPGA
jgi:RimJ/RimL family protein N-acetyltransferase